MAIIKRLHNVKTEYFALLIASCLFLRRSAEDSVSVFPSDTEAEVGETVTMYCRILHAIATDIEWHHTPYGLQKLNAVYLDGLFYPKYEARFNVIGDAQKSERNLRISNVSFEDAGKYICMHKSDIHPAELLVFDTFPSSQACAAIIPKNGLLGNNVCRLEPDNINISCNYSYRGNNVPAIEWKNASGNILPSILTITAKINISTLIHKAVMNDNFTCYMKYASSDFKSKFSWKVFIPVHNILHNETLRVIKCGAETISCATQSPQYKCEMAWKSSNGSILPGTALNTTDLPDGRYHCSANCIVRDTTCIIEQQTVERNCPTKTKMLSDDTKHGSTTVTMAVVIPGVIILVAAAAFAVFMFWRRRNEKKNKTSSTREAELFLSANTRKHEGQIICENEPSVPKPTDETDNHYFDEADGHPGDEESPSMSKSGDKDDSCNSLNVLTHHVSFVL